MVLFLVFLFDLIFKGLSLSLIQLGIDHLFLVDILQALCLLNNLNFPLDLSLNLLRFVIDNSNLIQTFLKYSLPGLRDNFLFLILISFSYQFVLFLHLVNFNIWVDYG